jgi:hypothetical protein
VAINAVMLTNFMSNLLWLAASAAKEAGRHGRRVGVAADADLTGPYCCATGIGAILPLIVPLQEPPEVALVFITRLIPPDSTPGI